MSETRTEMTVEQARAAGLLDKAGRKGRPSKHGNVRTQCANGHVHASGIEAKRCDELHLMKRARTIGVLTVQPKFLLAAKYTDRGKQYRVTYYHGDFFYVENSGQAVCEDVKAIARKTGKPVTTPLFRDKWKRVIRLNPDIEFRIV